MHRALLLLALLVFAPFAHASILHVVVDDVIHPVSDEYIGRALDRAKQENAKLVVLELRTPGGLLTSTRSIVEKIVHSQVPVVVYVAPSGARAASAGFFILVAADIAAMAPGTNTGASHPVTLNKDESEIMMKKARNDTAAFMRSIAQRRGRNVAAAESAVNDARSFSEDEALQQKVIDVIAPDLGSLLRWADGRTIRRFNGSTVKLQLTGETVTKVELTPRQKLLSWIMDPNVAFILMSLGMLALWAEFNHPGAILPGVVGLIAIILAVIALNLLPTRFAAFALILAAFALFALEAKFTSYGVLGTGGVICLVLGGVMLVDGPIPELRVSLATALAVSVPIGIIAVFLMTLVLRARKHRVSTGTEGMIGEIGVARTAIDGAGKVFVHGELWNARSRDSIEPGARVRVAAVDGLHVVVERTE
jgi:membrane-bound serine protease (ClpP class)